MSTSETHKIRPAGRHLLTIGRDLIQDSYAAVVELVKNAFDADSTTVDINFSAQSDGGYKVIIADKGHGMSRDTVINSWLVPSTDNKLTRKISPAGRVMQGRKGVGRYAAAVLGSDLLMETVNSAGEKTTVYILWDNFEKAEYLDDVEILVETESTNEPTGTVLTITGDVFYSLDWDKKQFDKLRFELKKLISPVGEKMNDDEFIINLKISNFSEDLNIEERVESFPIFDLFDYRIHGKIDSNGKGNLTYSVQKARNAEEDCIPVNLDEPTNCGDLTFDIRVYDREAEAIELLIGRGLKDDTGHYVGKNQARQILNDSNGMGVYRNGFRIRPLGDPDFDWLKLNEQRVQNPSMRIGSNQVIGYVIIQSEEHSNLIEKSARDGLKENTAFKNLKDITKTVIGHLEQRRFDYRRKAGLSKPALRVERELERIFSFDSLKHEIREKLTRDGVTGALATEVINLIDKDEIQKSKAADDIRQAVATYQGQATLGKIINVVLHEGRRPLSFFKNEVPRIAKLNKRLHETHDLSNLEEILTISSGVEQNSAVLSDLFKRLDPLASGKRPPKKDINIKEMLKNVFNIFREEMTSKNIEHKVYCDDNAVLSGWSQDFYAIFSNLIDNSIYWIVEKKSKNKVISINVVYDNEQLRYLDYQDSGPGIEPNLIERNVIFEPHFSTKISGTGIGLAIAGEAADRNGLELKALASNDGAYFRLQIREN